MNHFASSLSSASSLLTSYLRTRDALTMSPDPEVTVTPKRKQPRSLLKLRVCSLFSGTGGFEHGVLKSLGPDAVEVVFASDINKFARNAYKLTTGIEAAGDITLVDAATIPDHDVLVGGFPCQAFSMAGKRLGFAETRGTLFGDVARICAEKRPSLVVLENVRGLLNHDSGKTITTVLQVLSDLGYYVDFAVLNAKFFDLPQNRERVIIVATTAISKKESFNALNCTPEVSRRKLAINTLGTVRSFNFSFPEQVNVRKVIADILEPDVPEKYYLKSKYASNLQSKLLSLHTSSSYRQKPCTTLAQLFLLPKYIHNDQDRQRRVYDVFGVSPTLLARADSPKIVVVGELDMNAYKQVRTVYSITGLSPTIDTAQGGHRQVKVAIPPNYRIRKLTPLECFRLQGFDDSVYKILKDNAFSDTQLYKLAGNAVPPNMIRAMFDSLSALLP